jgi:predicted transcriptional regulator
MNARTQIKTINEAHKERCHYRRRKEETKWLTRLEKLVGELYRREVRWAK